MNPQLFIMRVTRYIPASHEGGRRGDGYVYMTLDTNIHSSAREENMAMVAQSSGTTIVFWRDGYYEAMNTRGEYDGSVRYCLHQLMNIPPGFGGQAACI